MLPRKFQNTTVPSFFDRFFNDDMFDWSTRHFSNTNTTIPSVNIKENDDAFEVEMAAPGLKKDDFKIELENDVLTVSCEKKEEKNETKKRFSKQEFSYQSFSRSFTLPNTVKHEQISAKYDDGILNINIPKTEEAKPKPPKQISIQ